MTSQTKFSDTVKVWDPLVRIFHWILVGGFFIAFITEEDFITLHTYAGYVVFILMIFRLFWGIWGNQYARFSNFIYSPKTISRFIKDTFQFKAKRYLGHNPAGGAMIILLMISIILCTLSGMAVYAIEDQAGPMAGWLIIENNFWREALEELHEFLANFILLLIVIHIAGVVIESFIHQENLIKSMLTGYKRGNQS